MNFNTKQNTNCFSGIYQLLPWILYLRTNRQHIKKYRFMLCPPFLRERKICLLETIKPPLDAHLQNRTRTPDSETVCNIPKDYSIGRKLRTKAQKIFSSHQIIPWDNYFNISSACFYFKLIQPSLTSPSPHFHPWSLSPAYSQAVAICGKDFIVTLK